jgi:PASTA domain
MTAYVEECRQEWKRLGVPDLLAEEMATELESDLAEAEADGVSAVEMLGESDPRRFAATWAVERGLVTRPTPKKGRRRWIWIAVGLVLALVFTVVLGLFAAVGISTQTHASPPPPQTVAIAVVPDFVGMTRPQALSLARRIGLAPTIRVVSRRGRPAGVVIAQAPADGARLRRGSTVLLRVGRG